MYHSGGGTPWRFVKTAVGREDQEWSFAPDAASALRRRPDPPDPNIVPRGQGPGLRWH
jgi:hypothetical protein